MRKKSFGSSLEPIDGIRVVLLKSIEEVMLSLGLWKSEIEIRGKSVGIDERTEFLVESLIGMAEVA
jgi:hypothetical protein